MSREDTRVDSATSAKEEPKQSQSKTSPVVTAPTLRVTRAMDVALDTIRMDDVDFNGLSLGAAVERISAKAKAMDPKRDGVNFHILEDEAPIRDLIVNSFVPLQQVSLRAVLDDLVKSAPGVSLEYEAMSSAVVIRTKRPPIEPLFTRTFKLTTNQVKRFLGPSISEATTPPAAGEEGGAIRARFTRMGVDLKPPKQMFLSDKRGLLMVRGSSNDLVIVERALAKMINIAQVVLETKFIEMSEAAAIRAGIYTLLGQSPDEDIEGGISNKPIPAVSFLLNSRESGSQPVPSRPLPEATVTGVLSPAETERLLKGVQSEGGNILAPPLLITRSMGQCQIKIEERRTIVIGMDRSDPSSPRPVMQALAQGPFLALIPTVEEGEVTIRLSLAAQWSAFLGYESAKGILKSADPDAKPRIRVLQAQAAASVQDNQTFVFSLGRYEEASEGKRRIEKKSLFVFVTPTLVDEAGNRIHHEGE